MTPTESVLTASEMTLPELALIAAQIADERLPKELQEGMDVEELAGLKLSIDTIRKKLGEADTALAEYAKENSVVTREGTYVPGIGKVELGFRPAKVSWDSEGLLALLVAQAQDERRIDTETGEALEPAEAPVIRVITECAPLLTPSFAWRLKPTRARVERSGRDLDEYQEIERDEEGKPKFHPYLKIHRESA